MNCSVCSAELEEGAQFCGVCGTRIGGNDFSPGVDQQGDEQPMVGFGEAIGRGFKNYVNFNGRANRAEYWWWALFAMIISVIPFVNILGLATIIPSFSLGARRLHDIGRTGWWLLLPWLSALVAVFLGLLGSSSVLVIIAALSSFGGIILLFVFSVLEGDMGPNKYGPDPRTTPRQ